MSEQPINNYDSHLQQTKKARKGPVVFMVIILLLVVIGGFICCTYIWSQSQKQQASINDKDAKIQSLNKEISSLKLSSVHKADENVVSIRELGISITVPDTIKDLTYSYIPISNENGKFEAVDFSTKSLSDQYASTDRSSDECTSFGVAPPLGAFEKWRGVYANNQVTSHLQLAKQLNGFYITYDSPQASCTTKVQPGPNPTLVQLGAFQNSFSSIKQL